MFRVGIHVDSSRIYIAQRPSTDSMRPLINLVNRIGRWRQPVIDTNKIRPIKLTDGAHFLPNQLSRIRLLTSVVPAGDD